MKLSIQAQAFVSLIIKFSIALAVIFAIMGLVTLVPLDLLIGSTSVLIMLFCIYNLYQIKLMNLKNKQDTKIDSK
jgi:predicted Co/Zn/Cd cation transporter (cation efflux family)